MSVSNTPVTMTRRTFAAGAAIAATALGATAAHADEKAAEALLIEKNPLGPGVRGSIGAVGSRYQLEDGCDLKATDIVREMQMYSASNVDPKLLRLWADESAETVEWYGDVCTAAGRDFGYNADHDLDDVRDIMNYRHWATSHANIKDGHTSEGDEVLVGFFQDHGGQILYSTAMVKLEQDANGRVTGVIHGTNRLDSDAIADVITFGHIAGASAAQVA